MYSIIDTGDFDELAEAQSGWDMQYWPICSSQFTGKLEVVLTDGLQIDIEQWSSSIEIAGASSQKGIAIVLPLNLAESGHYSSSGKKLTTQSIELYDAGTNVDAVLKPGCSLISCTLSNDLMSAQTNNPAAALIAEKCKESRLINSTRTAVSELVQWLNTVLNVLKSDDISYSNHQQLVDETILAVARTLSTGQAAQNLSIHHRYLLARRAREYMLERKLSPPSITEICNALHTSERTLHYAFKELYGVSPKNYIKAQRLFAAYSDLQTAEPLVKVSDIAHHYGFLDMSYFAKDYREMFGELPSVTLGKSSNRNATNGLGVIY